MNGIAAAKIDCSPVTNKSNDLPRIAAIGTNPAGTGAHAIAAALAAVGKQDHTDRCQSPTLQWPQCLDAAFAKWRDRIWHHEYPRSPHGNDRNRQLQKAFSNASRGLGRCVSVSPAESWCVISPRSSSPAISRANGWPGIWRSCDQSDLGKTPCLEVSGLKPAMSYRCAYPISTMVCERYPRGKVDASFTGIGIGSIEEVNAMEPIRFLSLADYRRRNKILLARYGASIVKQTPGHGHQGRHLRHRISASPGRLHQGEREDRLHS